MTLVSVSVFHLALSKTLHCFQNLLCATFQRDKELCASGTVMNNSKRALIGVKLCAFQEINSLVVHGYKRMKNKVMDCKKSQQITIWMCRHSFMCGYDSRYTAASWSNIWDVRDGELKNVDTSQRGRETSFNSTTQRDRGWGLYGGMSYRWAQVSTPRTHLHTLKPWCRMLHTMAVSFTWLYNRKVNLCLGLL